jgi:4-diphosphocytidyl-2C-methyl-D-erythritol kinase
LEDRADYRILTNELEGSALEEAPDLGLPVRRIREMLEGEGASLAAMSGSGSTCFGLFEDFTAARRAVESLRASGFAAHRARTLTRVEFRRDWSLRLGRQTSRRPRQRGGHHGDHRRQDHSGRR